MSQYPRAVVWFSTGLHVRAYALEHGEILVDGTHEANGHKPLCLHRSNKPPSRHHHQRINVHAATAAKRFCRHMQASKQIMSRCHGDAALTRWRRDASSLACVRRPTKQQPFGTASRQVVLAVVQSRQHQQQVKPPRCLDKFPLRPTGAAEACAGPESSCGSAAPTARPRTLFSGCELCDGTQAPVGVVESCGKCPEQSRQGEQGY